MALMNPFSGQEKRHRYKEQTCARREGRSQSEFLLLETHGGFPGG